MGQTAENVASIRGLKREDLDHLRSARRTSLRRPSPIWLRARDHPGHPRRRHRRVRRRRSRAGVTYDAISQLQPVFPPDGVVTAGNRCPLNDVPPRPSSCSTRRPPSSVSPHPLARIVTGVSGLSPGDHGPRSRRGDPQRASARRDDHRRHRPAEINEACRPGAAVGRGPRHPDREAQRQRWRDRRRPPVRRRLAPACRTPCSTRSTGTTRPPASSPCASVAARAWRSS